MNKYCVFDVLNIYTIFVVIKGLCCCTYKLFEGYKGRRNMALNLVCVKIITRGICFVIRSTAAFQFVFVNILLLSHLPLILMETKPDIVKSENMTDLSDKHQTWKISNMPDEQLKLFQDFLEIMEKLDMLNLKGNQSGCFYLEKVKRDITFPEKSKPRIGIHFYFEEAQIISDSSSKIARDKNIYSDHFHNSNGHLKTGDCNSSPLLLDKPGLDRLSRKQDDKNQNLTHDSSSNRNVTGSSGAKQTGDGNSSQDDRQRGLSRTQVVVIATCSAVIGTFFIIAGAMRIHSCLKRYRANREAALVIARRSSAFGFAGSGNLRRDSSSSKASRQQSHPTSKSGSDIQIDRNGRSQLPISHNSPQHSSDHNPLLPVHLVGQFSDGNSSHGSLVFIDEETHSRSKQNDNTSGSEFGSEDDPLLRKSPDSGSSIDICLETDDKVNVKEEHMKLSSETLKDSKCTSPEELGTTPERKVVFEPGGDTNTDITDININMPVETPDKDKINEHETHNTEDNVNKENNAYNNTDLMNLTDDYEQKRNGENIVKEPITNEESILATTLEDGSKRKDSVQGKADTCPRKQFSVDYFDVDDNGVEIQNPIFEEVDEAEPYEQLSENQVVTTGLTQSDSSLSDNPSYAYGNQTEYNYIGGYGQAGYCCPYMSTDNNIKCLDSSFIHNSLRNAVFLSAETLRRENGELQNESFDESSLSGSSRKNSYIDDIERAKYQRMYSTDSYFTSPLNRTAPFERTHSASPEDIDETGTKSTDNTTSTRKLHIIPLHEYHRNSLKGTIDEDDDE